MNKISVFGASGFIGSRFCSMFPERVIPIPRDSRSPLSDEILYFISTTDNYNIYDNLQIDIDTNLKVLMEVLEETKKRGTTPTFNFISSWFVYGQGHLPPFSERLCCQPTGFYSITKLCAEQMLICFCKTFGIKYRIFRLANVLGEGDKGVSKKKNALQYLIREIVNGQDIHLYEDGYVYRDFIYVNDVCEALALCIDKAPANQIINIGLGEPNLLRDLLNYAKEFSGSKSKFLNMAPTEFHKIVQTRNAYLDVDKLTNLGFRRRYPIRQVIRLLTEYYRTYE